ncbi:hypothetical protein DL96DRAFT_1812534 [Flagelloscypha sp. PMI_526]|nr:hypothetical protein DL96DRAFT_1812534 [Flagelloscypha sp. PMI_526]
MNILTLSTVFALISTVFAAENDAQTRSNGYFRWSPTSLSTFVVAIWFGLCTLCWGGYWIWKHYAPTANVTPEGRLQLGAVWTIWVFSILFYGLTAGWSAILAHSLTLKEVGKVLAGFGQADRIEFASWAFLATATTGWMLLLLSHTFILGKMVAGEALPQSTKKIMRSIFFFLFSFSTKNMLLQWTVSMLLTSVVFGGIILPATQTVFSQIVYLGVNLLTSFLLLSFVIKIRRTTLAVGKSDPLKWVLFICVPMWIVTGLVHLVVAIVTAFNSTRSPIGFIVTTSAFYASSFATIQILSRLTVGSGAGKVEV